MEPNIFVVNPGSSSRKYAFYQGEKRLASFHFEQKESGFVVISTIKDKTTETSIKQSDYDESLVYVQAGLREGDLLLAKTDVVGVRIVAPGTFFQTHRVIDDEYEVRLREVATWAPLHIEPVLKELLVIRKLLPEVQLVGISDSAFHASLSDEARHYALPYHDAKQFDIFRFGYHGISVQSAVRGYEQRHGSLPAKTIVCHLGGGSSITALQGGVSIETSMGFTPLEGVPMTTRVGDLDAGALLYLVCQLGINFEEATDYFTNKSGLLGISGATGDVRELLKREALSDTQARLALGIYTYKIRKYIGSYIAVLNGLDLLVLTATISERSVIMRQRIVAGLDGLGIVMDEKRNNELSEEGGFIESEKASSRVVVVPTDEMSEIAYRVMLVE